MATSLQSPKVLLVDDEVDNLKAIERLLRKDFEVVVANSGEAALEMLREQDFYAILSDQRMPGMQGSDFLEKAEALRPLATRMLLTGFADLDAVVEAINRGQIWRYLSKPWEPEDLKQAIKQAVERSKFARNLETYRRDLERANSELRAKEWARSRLFQLLLHEFRTAPQVLEGLAALDPGGADQQSRMKFIDDLRQRFSTLEREISGLMDDERRITTAPKSRLNQKDFLAAITNVFPKIDLGSQAVDATDIVSLEVKSFFEALVQLQQVMQKNTQRAPVEATVSWPKESDKVFVLLRANAKDQILPESLATEFRHQPQEAWNAVLEPFVGTESVMHHGGGMRLQMARHVRLLAAQGCRVELSALHQGTQIELVLSIPRLKS